MTTPTHQNLRRRRIIAAIILVLLIIFLVWAGVKAYRLGKAAQSLLAKQVEVEALASGGLTSINPDEAEQLVLEVRQDIQTIRRETAVFMPLTPLFGWLPTIGPLIADAPHLIEMADAGSEAAAYAMRGLKPALVILQTPSNGQSQIPALVQALHANRADLHQASTAFQRVSAARAHIDDISGYPTQLRDLFTKADPYLPMAEEGLRFLPLFPAFMGAEGPRDYLLVAQNNDELRATGGFYSGVGYLVLDQGNIVRLDFTDASLINDWNTKPYDFPPQALYEIMGLELFLFRDANFWPDFPTSAENSINLYEYGQDMSGLDGVIAIDQPFMELLISGTGPVFIPDTNQTVNASNIIASFRDTWNQEEGESVGDWFNSRKAFLSTFSGAILNRLQSGFSEIDPVYFAQLMFGGLDEKHLQIYVRDPEMAAALNDLNWDGRLENSAGQDYLMVVDNNMGYNKVNMHISRTTDYQVAIQPDGTAVANLALTYTHPLPDNGIPCVQGVIYANAPAYEEIANQCYFNYVRIYTPPGSTLLNSSRSTIPAEHLIRGQAWDSTAQTVNEFAEFTTFANFIMVPRASSQTVTFQYQLPPVIQAVDGQQQYRLTLQRQSGTENLPYTVTITLPPGTTLVNTQPTPTAVSGSQVQFQFPLTTDTTLQLTYK
jgi:hypothetical protein